MLRNFFLENNSFYTHKQVVVQQTKGREQETLSQCERKQETLTQCERKQERLTQCERKREALTQCKRKTRLSDTG